ncbi:MAG TPA: rod shape-determining protein MreB [Cytophagales bacterium]|nr:rod shape-determining protein MreB [Cytophagales bacterium]
MGFKRNNLAVDLGNNNTIIADKESILLDEPSIIVFNKENKSVKAVGDEAFGMIGKTHNNLKTIKPLRSGVIADFESARTMLHSLVKKIHPLNGLLKGYDTIITGVPYSSTEVERRALRDAVEPFGASNNYLVFEPVAAAIGMGLDIQEPDGKFIVDIGGGITEIVVVSLSGIVSYQSLKIGGETFDEDIQDYFRRTYNMAIGLKEAQEAKHKAGAVLGAISDIPEPYYVAGKDLLTGVPKKVVVDHLQLADILDKSVSKIEHAILQALEECLPELASDIYVNGIHLTGGGSLLRGFKKRLEEKTKLEVHHDENALQSVSKGISIILNDPRKYKSVLFK